MGAPEEVQASAGRRCVLRDHLGCHSTSSRSLESQGSDPQPETVSGEGASRLKSGPPHRFHATVDLSDPRRPVPQFSEIAQHVIGHLAGVTDASPRIRVEIEAEHKGNGFAEHIECTVSENARTLKFNDFGFEDGSNASDTPD